MRHIELAPKEAIRHKIELMVSLPEQQPSLCFQFETKEGLSPVYSVSLIDESVEFLEHIAVGLELISRSIRQPALPGLVDVAEDNEREADGLPRRHLPNY